MMTKPKARSRILDAVHETASDLHRLGFIDKRKMQKYEALCLEPVPEYDAAKIRERLELPMAWVSSYNNDGFGYLPTAQIIQEGGHEAIGLTVWLWQTEQDDVVGFFSEDVEKTVVDAVAELADDKPEN